MAQPADKLKLRTDFCLLIDGALKGGKQHLDVINPALGSEAKSVTVH